MVSYLFMPFPNSIHLSIFVGAAQCLGELYKHFGRRITSGLLETTMIATKLIKFYEVHRSICLCPYNFVHAFDNKHDFR